MFKVCSTIKFAMYCAGLTEKNGAAVLSPHRSACYKRSDSVAESICPHLLTESHVIPPPYSLLGGAALTEFPANESWSV